MGLLSGVPSQPDAWTPCASLWPCPCRDLSVDAGLSSAQFQVRPVPQQYQHYLATLRMHHFPRNSSSTQMVSERLCQETDSSAASCANGGLRPEALFPCDLHPCAPRPGRSTATLPSQLPVPIRLEGERKESCWIRNEHCWKEG